MSSLSFRDDSFGLFQRFLKRIEVVQQNLSLFAVGINKERLTALLEA